ncbi:BTB/POZ domain [Dillenia turbinata]|uniref:BTB/POZ domain n=1 Tax=Dillenia turbinata TaxID=194707 RepID=A0AAN8W1D8_9MAGN
MPYLPSREGYASRDAGTSKGCYEEASETEELKRENDDLKSKLAFVRLYSSLDPSSSPCFSDADRSPVFRAMFENKMKESWSGTVEIHDVSHDALCAFVNYLYTAEACLDDQMACDLLVMAEEYQVEHLKDYCEKFIVSKLNWDNSISSYAFAHQHNAKHLLDAALSLIFDNMDKLTKHEKYMELREKDTRLSEEQHRIVCSGNAFALQ